MRVFFKKNRDIVMRVVIKLFAFWGACFFLNSAAIAAEWEWAAADDVYIAAVDNDSGNSFGQICIAEGDSNCYYFIYIDFTCEEDAVFPSLINSDSGAHSVNLKCGGYFKDGYLLAFNDFDRIDNIALKSITLGIAVALESGKFAVNRFNLTGSSKTIHSMREAALQGIDSRKEVKNAVNSSTGSELL